MSSTPSSYSCQKKNIERLLQVMSELRHPETGCPWDIEQTFRTIAPYTLEETYEVIEAIEDDDMAALKEELGDLLFQVVFHARMAEETGHFTFDDVAKTIADKMVTRHPHVFSPGESENDSSNSPSLPQNWEEMKAAERQVKGQLELFDDIPKALPALVRARKVQSRAARTGFDWPELHPVLDKIMEECQELKDEISYNFSRERIEEETGDLLFSVVNLARHLKVDPESTLNRATAKFQKRFLVMAALLESRGADLQESPLDVMEAAWQDAKKDS
ncbi:nucleoside triphosphate pyrophosphohydrolase [Fodinicurvata fenggangensis]|uniref:nucleoside triphosphate pyrophosphohydrolase n=1 Tax=Fodinicurvata fenggangensis TaxID=1121830 RepID=UPI000AB83A98|nr:nucleoside triphosphate pyrophosphohydrolase [Fodinicurvata fenggangensis]